MSSYLSRHRPSTAYPADTTRSRTSSPSGTRCDSAELLSPTRERSSDMSTRPSRSPSTYAVPDDGCSIAAAIRSSDVFPAPFGPMTTQRSSSSTDQVTGPTRVWSPRRSVTLAKSISRSGSARIVWCFSGDRALAHRTSSGCREHRGFTARSADDVPPLRTVDDDAVGVPSGAATPDRSCAGRCRPPRRVPRSGSCRTRT